MRYNSMVNYGQLQNPPVGKLLTNSHRNAP
jgi:hypothetical protein